MGRVQVLGAGECGLPLALRLRRGGMPVTLVTDRGADAVLAGSVTSTQVKFGATLQLESDAGLGAWRDAAPEIKGIRFVMAIDRTVVAEWAGRFNRPAQSVDQRTVFARWLADFEAEGGNLEIVDRSPTELERRAAAYDLTVVTRASRELAACFPTNPAWPVAVQPMRRLAALYLDGVRTDPDGLGTYVALPGHGEVISYPGLTGPPGQERGCEIMLIEAIPNGALDVFGPGSSPAERLAQARQLLDRHLPGALAERYRDAQLTDGGASLVGAVTPTMRRPVGTLPSGTPVLGGGDVVCRMDPGGAQGANNAAHCAFHYGEAILRHRDGPYDHSWMAATAAPWLTDIAHPAARWTTAVLDPPEPVQKLMQAAQHDQALADAFADTFARPANMALLAIRTPA